MSIFRSSVSNNHEGFGLPCLCHSSILPADRSLSTKLTLEFSSGTGTPAGDPIEAEAIKRAFFPDQGPSNKNGTLFVGSIKTVIGHLEGVAGLAGVMKASLALQNSTIPPNMHFDRLHPSVRPFYDNLQIVTTSEDWPAIAQGLPRRASVNSFGKS